MWTTKAEFSASRFFRRAKFYRRALAEAPSPEDSLDADAAKALFTTLKKNA
jgi:hypothetical protein